MAKARLLADLAREYASFSASLDNDAQRAEFQNYLVRSAASTLSGHAHPAQLQPTSQSQEANTIPSQHLRRECTQELEADEDKHPVSHAPQAASTLPGSTSNMSTRASGRPPDPRGTGHDRPQDQPWIWPWPGGYSNIDDDDRWYEAYPEVGTSGMYEYLRPYGAYEMSLR